MLYFESRTREFERLNGVLDMSCEREDRDPTELERSVNLHMRMRANEADAQRIRARTGGAPAEDGRSWEVDEPGELAVPCRARAGTRGRRLRAP